MSVLVLSTGNKKITGTILAFRESIIYLRNQNGIFLGEILDFDMLKSTF